ncbi:MAG: hypothetical protein V3T71_03205, partial [Dehalococcoidia bacterium]
MRTQYTHMRLDEDVYSISGFYTPIKEVRLRHGDRDASRISLPGDKRAPIYRWNLRNPEAGHRPSSSERLGEEGRSIRP